MRKDYLTPQEVADMLGFHLSTVWRWIREEKLPAIKSSNSQFGITYRIMKKDLNKFLKKNKTVPNPRFK